jgi:hypothetical protein
MRFAPTRPERPISVQISALSPKVMACFNKLKQKWEAAHPTPFSDEMYLRFARCSPGGPCNEKTACKVMKNYSKRYLTLNVTDLESQLQTKTLFPVPGLQWKDACDVLYMRPSRYHDKETPTKDIIDNLVYVMSTMVERERPCVDGITFLANMKDWSMQNVSRR